MYVCTSLFFKGGNEKELLEKKKTGEISTSGEINIAYIHAYIHTYIHTYIHSHIHTYPNKGLIFIHISIHNVLLLF